MWALFSLRNVLLVSNTMLVWCWMRRVVLCNFSKAVYTRNTWLSANRSPLTETVWLNVFCPLGVSLLRMRPWPPTGLMGGSEAPDSISLNWGKVTATDRNTGHQQPKPPHAAPSPHFLSFCLLLGQTLPVDAVTFIPVTLCYKALLLNFKCLNRCCCTHIKDFDLS